MISNCDNEDLLFENIEKKYSDLGKERGTSYEVELMRALETLIPEAYKRVPGFLADLTCELDLPEDEIEAAKELEVKNPKKYEKLCGYLAETVAELKTEQLELLVA